MVCVSDAQEPGFNVKTVRDGLDLEFDGCSKLFITIRYRRFTYTASNLVDVECDPLLTALIRRCDPYAGIDESEEVEDHAVIVNGSEFEDYDGCLYRVVSVDTTRVHSRCCYPQSNSVKFGLEKSFDIQLAKELIELRLNG